MGPSGAPVWSARLRSKSGVLLYGTGKKLHRTCPRDTVTRFFAVNANTGKRIVNQFTANDTFNMACVAGTANCPEDEA
ncbi:MAG: hypothetical protein CM15mP68_6720 [Pseudomonadota bacterium]|nr:MAG: hypothetical protein CM15mP68_6720 [Pseudomonadota bacterium]